MARPRRSTAESFYDVFADFSIEDQAAALKILEQVHRLAVRESKRANGKQSPHDAEVDRMREREEGGMDDTAMLDMEARCPTRE